MIVASKNGSSPRISHTEAYLRYRIYDGAKGGVLRPDNRLGRGTRSYAPQGARRNRYGTEKPLPFRVLARRAMPCSGATRHAFILLRFNKPC